MPANKIITNLFIVLSCNCLPDRTFSALICLLFGTIKFSKENWDKDAELVRRLKRGDKDACVELLDKYKMDLYMICFFKLWNKQGAEDAVSEAFTRSFENIWDLKDEKKYYGWLKTIAVNYCKDIIERRNKEGGELPENDSSDITPINVSIPMSSDKIVEKREIISSVRRALNELDDDEREIVVLKHFQEVHFTDVAVRLGISVNTAKTRFYRALEKLGKKLPHLKGLI